MNVPLSLVELDKGRRSKAKAFLYKVHPAKRIVEGSAVENQHIDWEEFDSKPSAEEDMDQMDRDTVDNT